VERIVAVGGGGPIELSEAAVELAAERPFLRATAGIHPHDAKTYNDDIERRIVALIERRAIAAVGETGLDYYYEHSPRDVQRRSLARQLVLARDHELPVVLHCRDAEDDLREVLESERTGEVRGVVHCFTGSYEHARWYLDKGLLVSFTGILTFKNALDLREVARRLPLDRLMVETDSPYLAPVPHRGKRNEPAFVAHVAEALAEVRGVSTEVVAEATTRNALELFFVTA
jgi:TatD DNase family protein